MGTVENIDGTPMIQATIKIQGIERSHTVSKRSGYFKLMLPEGTYTMQITCHKYRNQSVTVTVSDNKLSKLKIRLIEEERKIPEVYQGTVVLLGAPQIDVTDKSITEPFKGNIRTGIKGLND